MRHALPTALLLTALAASSASCTSQEDRVRETVQSFAAAATYKDTEALFRLHVDSRGEGILCDKRFEALYEKAGASKSPETCRSAADVLAQPKAQRQKMEDSVVLLSEILHFRCDNPSAPCKDFARELFHRRARTSRLLTRDVTDVSVERVTLQGDEATAYVDVRYEGAQEVDKISLYLVRQADDAWLFKTYPW